MTYRLRCIQNTIIMKIIRAIINNKIIKKAGEKAQL
jgi:hypothetical protein